MADQLTLSSHFSRPVPSSVNELRQIPGAFPEDFPDEVAASLIDFARDNNFEISESRQEAMTLLFKTDGRYVHFITSTALKRRAISTGLWLPGTVEFIGKGFDLVAVANSWIRYSKQDQWVQGASVTVPYMEYYDRIPDTSQPRPLWVFSPYGRLSTVAECRAIYAALGDIISSYYVLDTITALDNDPNVDRLVNGEITYAEYAKLQGR